MSRLLAATAALGAAAALSACYVVPIDTRTGQPYGAPNAEPVPIVVAPPAPPQPTRAPEPTPASHFRVYAEPDAAPAANRTSPLIGRNTIVSTHRGRLLPWTKGKAAR